VHAGDERRGVVQDPVFERPGEGPRLACALTVMAQVGEPDVEPLGAKEVRASSLGTMQPGAVVRERAMDQQDGGPTIPKGAEPVQREIDAITRRQVARAHS
jgi:hypothetical protein